ncbi:unnamed protein product [Mycena citricolor]|uniref:Vacuolar protein sorting-associated protein 54 C-terminal domain-containing protein n=1 Tax=Mycena citricolor TaxID=2018698 RepID=A0AAD2GZ61_9AGAR|nr:unnamed protein product [Mycena citricolor]
MSEHSSSDPSRAPSPVSPLPPTARPYRFNWDSTPKGPESVSGTTEGRDYFAGPSRLNLLNSSTTSLAIGALPGQWSSSTHGFNAISTVLNNPHKRQAPPKAHSSLPAVPPTDLPRVRRKDFDSYLRAITPEWENLERNNQLDLEAEMQLEGSSTPRASSSQTPFVQTPGRPLPSLDIVPSVFFQPKFNLGDPRTFNAVTEQDSLQADPVFDPIALSYSLPLLEKFSHYADTVEQHLVREISLRSASFFAALTNLNELQSESEECLDRISKLRTLLKDVDEKTAKKGLEVVRTESRVRNLGKVRESVKFVGGVVEKTGVARSLVASGQWDSALDVLREMEEMWDGSSTSEARGLVAPALSRSSSSRKSPGFRSTGSLVSTPEERPLPPPPSPPPIPLSSLSAFAALPEHLRILTMEITTSLTNDVMAVLRVDLLERIGGDVPSTESPERNEVLKGRLRPLLQALNRTKGLREAMLSWREVVMDETRNVIKQRLPAFDPGEEEGSGEASKTGLANHLRTMGHSDFLALLQGIYKSFLNGIEGLSSQIAALLEVVGSGADAASDRSSLQDDLSDMLGSAAELANTQAAKLVVMRAEQHSALPLSDFIAFFDDSWSFVIKCEVICRKMFVGLRGVIISQSKTFLQAFHQARLMQSGSLVENEQWEQIDVTPAMQSVVNILIDSAVQDVPSLLLAKGSDGTLPSVGLVAPSADGANGRTPTSPSAPVMKRSNGSSSAKNAKTRLRIEERTFSLVSATAETLTLLLDYLRIIMNLSMLTTDTMSRVIEFLKAFNSRTCQVVLGAGAMRSAGLKNITAKHLALASQSLSIAIGLIPYVRETFRRHLSQKQAVMLIEFDKLKRDYQEHQYEIHAKLIAIMGDRLSTHIRAFQVKTSAVDWTMPGEGVNSYMSVLVKETTTLHKVLSRHLSAAVIEEVMSQVFAAINHRLSEEYGQLVLPSEEARQRLLADVRYLHQELSKLKNVGAPSGMLELVIAELRIPQATSPAANATKFAANGNSNANAPASNSRLLANRLRWNSLTPNAANPTSNPPQAQNGPAPNPNESSLPVTPVKITAPSRKASSSGFRQMDPTSPVPEGVGQDPLRVTTPIQPVPSPVEPVATRSESPVPIDQEARPPDAG